MKLSKPRMRFRWFHDWRMGGFWSVLLSHVLNDDGTPFMCKRKFGAL